MNKLFRSSLLILLAMAFALCCTACSGGEQQNNNKVVKTAEEVCQEVLEVSGFGEMTLVPKRDYAEIYGIDVRNFVENDYVWYVSDNPSLNADEVVIIHVEREEYRDVLISILQKHLDTRLAVAESYSPEEAAKLKNVEIGTAQNSSGIWVYYCIGEQYTKMMGVIRSDIG